MGDGERSANNLLPFLNQPRDKKLLGASCIATSSKDATSKKAPYYTSNNEATHARFQWGPERSSGTFGPPASPQRASATCVRHVRARRQEEFQALERLLLTSGMDGVTGWDPRNVA